MVANPDGHYYIEWGTSAAAAFVSGAVALVRSAHPGIDPAQIKKLLADTARDAPAQGRDDARGYGIVDPAEAIEAGSRLRTADLDAKAAPAGHRGRYFGEGPAPDRAADATANWAAPLAGGLGAALLAAAVVLWRGRNAPGRR